MFEEKLFCFVLESCNFVFLSFSTFFPRLVSLDGLWFVTIHVSQIYPGNKGGGGKKKRQTVKKNLLNRGHLILYLH